MASRPPKRKDRPGVDRAGRTPLHNAVIDQNLEQVHSILLQKPDVNAQDDNGWTPIHFAANAKSLEILDALIAAGSDVEIRDSHGSTPLFRAVFTSNGDGDKIKSLRMAGASAYSANQSGTTPLSLARMIVNFPVAQYFADLR
jgi:uncharacterized protein